MLDVVLTCIRLVARAFAVLAITLLSVNIAKGVVKHHAKRKTLSNVPGPQRHSLFTGNLVELFDAHGGLSFYESLSMYGGVVKIHGLFGDVSLLISDPQVLAHMLVKDPNNFPSIDVAGSIEAQRWLFGPGLVGSNGSPHRRQRKMLNPAFSHAQMRNVMPVLSRISCQLRETLEAEADGEVDVAEWFGRSSLEFIGQAAFGHTFHALEGDGSAYVRALKEIIPVVAVIGPILRLFILSGASQLSPWFLRAAGHALSAVFAPLRDLLHIKKTYYTEGRAIWDARGIAFKANIAAGAGRDDESRSPVLLDVLLDENGEARVTEEEMISQITSVVFGGTETTSTVLSRILHLFALYPDAQDRLREELSEALAASRLEPDGEDSGIKYDSLMALPFLDAICKETLRLFAPVPFRPRRSLDAAIVSNSDGTSLHIPADTEIFVNIHGVNTDEQIWGDDAHVWKPERWLAPLPASVIHAKVPGVFANQLTFFAGPKSCIGLNFALVAIKTMLATLIPAFRFSLPLDHEIEWRFAQTITPSVKGEKRLNPRMPLRVARLNKT
ncbi:unnamed protein product [Peniophora sp. CBMAI 1063]|nr:unnamed protein product [Peniophora sp. CBMAI 1063]